MNETQRKLHEAALLLKSAATDIEKGTSKLDPAYQEAATAMACAGRAKRLLEERDSEAA